MVKCALFTLCTVNAVRLLHPVNNIRIVGNMRQFLVHVLDQHGRLLMYLLTGRHPSPSIGRGTCGWVVGTPPWRSTDTSTWKTCDPRSGKTEFNASAPARAYQARLFPPLCYFSFKAILFLAKFQLHKNFNYISYIATLIWCLGGS